MRWRLLQYKGAYDAFMADCGDGPLKKTIRRRLAQILEKGNECREPISRSLGKGLHEIKADHQRVRVRLLYGFLPDYRVVVVWGGTKDQRRLPPAVIARARVLLKEAEAEASAEVCDGAVIH